MKEVNKKVARWKKIAGWSAVIFFYALGSAAIWWTYWSGNGAESVMGFALRRKPPENASAPTAGQAPRAIDGVLVDASAPAARYFAVMIDNFATARPPAGISKASLVYEAPVEGGITRFMAVYADDAAVSKIGPVRSARPYYVDWAAEYDSLYAHVGGSPEALAKLSSGGAVRDINQFSSGNTFWRDTIRSAPHNVYTSTDRMKAMDDARFATRTQPPLDGWKFKTDAAPEDRPQSASLAIDFSIPEFRVTWTYDRSTDDYVRSQGGAASKDDDGAAMRAKNVVVQYCKVQTIDEAGRKRIDDLGQGDASFAIDGAVVHGTWKKDDSRSRTRFYDASGNEIKFNAGTTWIEVVPTDANVTAS